MPVTVADIGGTNARFAISSPKSLRLQHVTYLRCADFAGVEDAYAHFLASVPEAIMQDEDGRTPHVLSLAVAGPVNAELVEVSNNHWQFAKRQLMANLQLDGLLVINDFTAQSLAQSSILSGEIDTGHEQLLAGRRDIAGSLLVIGPGTGLGVSALIPLAEGLLPIESEGGNIRFAPQTDIERDLDAFMRKRTEHVIAEHLVSGSGLEAIYAFLIQDKNAKPAQQADWFMAADQFMSADQIGATALAEAGICRDAVDLMFGILGSVMADHVLTIGCWRGAVIAGGIVPRLAPLIDASPFAQRFRAVGAMSHLLADVPVWLSTDADDGLKGAWAALDNPYLKHRLLSV